MKGYPLEHIVGDCCPDDVTSIAEAVTRTLEEIARRFAPDAQTKVTPFLAARGVTDPEVNVMRRVAGEDFAGFHAKVVTAASLAREALDADTVRESALLWRRLLGPAFPKPPKECD